MEMIKGGTKMSITVPPSYWKTIIPVLLFGAVVGGYFMVRTRVLGSAAARAPAIGVGASAQVAATPGLKPLELVALPKDGTSVLQAGSPLDRAVAALQLPPPATAALRNKLDMELRGMAASSPEEYIQCVERDPTARWARPDDAILWKRFLTWKEYYAPSLPKPAYPKDLLAEYWKTPSASRAFISSYGNSQGSFRLVTFSIRSSDEMFVRIDEVFDQESEVDRWRWLKGPDVAPTPFRAPKVSLADVLARHGVAQAAVLFLAVETESQDRYVSFFMFVLDPATNLWSTDLHSTRQSSGVRTWY